MPVLIVSPKAHEIGLREPSWRSAAVTVRSGAISVSPAPDGCDLDGTSDIVNQIEDPVVAATCGVGRGQRWVEGFADTMGIVEQRPIDEFVCGLGDLLG